MEDLIKLAVEGDFDWWDYKEGLDKDQLYTFLTEDWEKPSYADLVCRSDFFQALGRKCGWGEWTMKLSDVVHIWEIEFYKPDTSKTPVYICDKCFARKVNEIVTLEIEYSYEEVKEGNYESRKVIRAHGGYLREPWIDIAKRFHEINLTEGWDKAVAYLQEVTK